MVCFGWYVKMLRSSETNYDLVIGFSAGLILMYLQGCVLWGALLQPVFEDLFMEDLADALEQAESTDVNCTYVPVMPVIHLPQWLPRDGGRCCGVM